MEFSIKAHSPETIKTGCVVLGVFQEKDLSAPARRVDQASKGKLRAALADLSGKAGSTLLLRLPGVAAERVLLAGLGERKSFAEGAYRDAVRGAAHALKELGAKDAAFFLVDLKVGARPLAWNVRHAVGGLRDAFSAAIEAGVPVLTSLSPAYQEAWESFAAPLSVMMPADPARLDAWWQAVRSPTIGTVGPPLGHEIRP